MSAEPGDGWVVLICPPGAESGKISHGTQCFEPYREDIENPRSRWLVKVPRGVVAHHLCRVGGFAPLPLSAEEEELLVMLLAEAQ